MRCTQTTSGSCERCLRLGRRCVATEPYNPNATTEACAIPAVDLDLMQGPGFAQTIPPDNVSERPAVPQRLLGSAIVSTECPSRSHGPQDEYEPSLRTRPYWSATDYVSAAEAADWILLYLFPFILRTMHDLLLGFSFKERLVPTAPVLDPNAYTNHERIVSDQPHLAACIVYVSSAYIAGYSGLRIAMQKGLNDFSRAMLEIQPATSAQQLTDMQVLIILYNFARPEAACSLPRQEVTSVFNLWSIKAICESYAFRIELFKTANDVLMRSQSGQLLQRSDQCVQFYLVWLWLFSNSHQ
ncbi:hypothetical protein IG631_23880 [Alternaria alternata]|nr:hypothetical protein IG631_23880 [Alternaria alternata]